ncbi:hypothetical protein QZN06_29475, partial [Burkholderia multivorans]|nr:hypothetical protein [Burkholderia multivorans]
SLSSSPRPEVLCDRAIATPDVLKVPSGYAIDLKLSTVFCDEPKLRIDIMRSRSCRIDQADR